MWTRRSTRRRARPSRAARPRDRAAGDRAIASSDAGIYLLAPPVESFRQFVLLLESEGFTEDELRRMNGTNPAALFKVGATAPLG